MSSDGPSDPRSDAAPDAAEWVAPVISLFGSRSGAGAAGSTGRAPVLAPDADSEAEAEAEAETGFGVGAGFGSDSGRRVGGDGSARERADAARTRAAEKAERRAQNVSVAALTRRGMSVAEMRDRLTERGIEADEVESEVTRLQNARYLDDASLAESVVRSETERKGRGRSAVAAELRRRRVDGAAIEAALESLDDEGELERAVAVAETRARQLRSYDAETARRRLYGFLQRRGFSGTVVQRAVDAALASH